MPSPSHSVTTLFENGNRHLSQHDYVSAEQMYLLALREDAGTAAILANLAYAREQQGAYQSARQTYLQALQLEPGNLQIVLNLGALLMRMPLLAEAEALYLQALETWPEEARLLSNYGALLAVQRRDAEAENVLRQALALQADYRAASYNLSYLLLRQSRWDEGWQRLEHRPWPDQLAKVFSFPRWSGGDCRQLALLLVFEGGFGDTFQFCRYAGWLRQHGVRRLGMVCHPPLAGLLKTMPDIDLVIPYDQDLPDHDWDYWVPLFSLPYCCGLQYPWYPDHGAYLQADPQRCADWRRRLPARGRKVGLAWRGNPRFENDAARSIHDVQVLAGLAQAAGLQWVSLQIPTPVQLPALPMYDPAGQIDDFQDTAALIAELDLVISVDTAVAHLAGALGKPCWLMLAQQRQDWRWQDGLEYTGWYPATRLFRQQAAGNWQELIARVCRALSDWNSAATGLADLQQD